VEIDKMRNLKVLERPDVIEQPNPPVSVSSSQKTSASQKQIEVVVEEISVPPHNRIVTIPPAPSDHYPDTNGGEDRDPVARERRLKVKEVCRVHDFSFVVLKLPECFPFSFQVGPCYRSMLCPWVVD